MRRVSRLGKLWTAAFIYFILLGVAPALVLAAEANKKTTGRSGALPSIRTIQAFAVARGETVQLDMTLENKGRHR